WNLEASKCYAEQWTQPLWRDRIFKLTPDKPFLNLGAGACQADEQDIRPLLDDPECVAFMRDVGRCGPVLTTRDRLAQRALAEVGVASELLPCPAFHAARRFDG